MKPHTVTGEITPEEKRKLILELNLHFLPEKFTVTVHGESNGSVTVTVTSSDGLSGERAAFPADFGFDKVKTAIRLANEIRGIHRP